MRFNFVIRSLKALGKVLLRVRQSVTVTHAIILADSEAVSLNRILALLPFLAKPCASSVRLFCQGSALRFDERRPRGLDSADGHARYPATKGICFFFSSGNHA